MTTRYAARRAGFTLVELLVVILIIAVLAALSLAGFSAARSAARKTAAVTEMAQVANAVAAYKAKMNASHIPAFGGGANGRFRLCTNYSSGVDPSGNPIPLPWPELTYLRSVFPQMSLTDNGLRVNGNTAVPNTQPILLNPNQTLLFFLTGSVYTNYQGFSTNKAQPFTTAGGFAGSILEVNAGKVFQQTDSSGYPVATYLDPWGTPYAYFAWDPTVGAYPSSTATPNPFLWPRQGDTHPTETSQALVPNAAANSGLAAFRQGGKFLNQRGFQIISAGPDQQFGFVTPNTDWAAGTGDYVSNGVGGDDISNFNSGPLNQQSGQ